MPQDFENPFDTPLQGEIQDHQQAQASTMQASSNGNPFNEPLMSEKAESQHTDAQLAYRKATAAGINTKPGEAEKAMGAVWGDNAAQAKQLLKNTGQAALETAGGVFGAPVAAMSLDAAAPLVTSLAEHLPTLDKAYKILTALGAGSYTVQHLKDVMKIIGGSGK